MHKPPRLQVLQNVGQRVPFPDLRAFSAPRPVGCGEVEDHLHYVKCKAEPMIAARQKSRLNVLTRLKRLRTNEFICSTISYILKSIGDCEEIQMYGERYESDDERNLLPALLGQKEIGWENLLKGFMHKGWAYVQRIHYTKGG